MTAERQIQFDQLVTALWNGQCSERDFSKRALEVGASLTAISRELEQMREEDGVS